MFINYKKIITPQRLHRRVRLDKICKQIKNSNDEKIKSIISGEDDRLLIVCGPCGADNAKAVLEYCKKLKELSLKVKDKIYLMPRLYTAKARSSGDGYLGMMFQPDNDRIDLNAGLIKSRKMIAECIAQTGLPIAEEFLFVEQLDYNSDLVSYYFLGARQSDSPLFRNIASGLDVAIGIKNDLAGNLNNLACSLHAVKTPKEFLFKGGQVSTTGNTNCHGVLRGFVNNLNQYLNNANQETIDEFNAQCVALNLKNDFVMIDCSHANSKKCAVNQIQNALNAVKNTTARGLMIESYLYGGRANDSYGVSKTDECLDWESTQKLILELYEIKKQQDIAQNNALSIKD